MAVDDSYIKTVIERYGDYVYRLSLHYVRSVADAEDIVQEVLMAFIKSPPKEDKVKGWLSKVTVNKSINLLKKRKRISDAPYDDGLSVNIYSNPEGLFDELSKLPPLDREIVYLTYYVGYTSKEVANIVKKSDAAVRKRLERAKILLKKYLQEDL